MLQIRMESANAPSDAFSFGGTPLLTIEEHCLPAVFSHISGWWKGRVGQHVQQPDPGPPRGKEWDIPDPRFCG